MILINDLYELSEAVVPLIIKSFPYINEQKLRSFEIRIEPPTCNPFEFGMCFDDGVISIRPEFFKRSSPPFVKEIFLHEFGHWVVQVLYESFPYDGSLDFNGGHHGKLWKSIGKLIGYFPKAFNSYPIATLYDDGEFPVSWFCRYDVHTRKDAEKLDYRSYDEIAKSFHLYMKPNHILYNEFKEFVRRHYGVAA